MLAFSLIILIFFFFTSSQKLSSNEISADFRIAFDKSSNTTKFSDKGEFPWHVAIFKKDRGYICGASLISEYRLLSAAHCFPKDEDFEVFGYDLTKYHAILGVYDLNESNDTWRVERKFLSISIHEEYGLIQDYYQSNADIAVIKMSQRVKFSLKIKPVKLPASISNSTNLLGTIYGYGINENEEYQNKPQKAEIRSISFLQCVAQDYRYIAVASERSFCAGDTSATPCEGDSGGGFFVKNIESGEYEIFGIVSTRLMLGMNCDPNHYAVFVDVTKFIDWINLKIPVTANIILPKGRSYSVGSEINLVCNVTGEPTPEITWYKDNRPIEISDKIEIPEPNQLVVLDAQPFDSGNYRCVARNDYSQAFAAEVISVEGLHIPSDCTDNKNYANCAVVVKGNFCNHKYYAKFCCRSCTLAGQIRSHAN